MAKKARSNNQTTSITQGASQQAVKARLNSARDIMATVAQSHKSMVEETQKLLGESFTGLGVTSLLADISVLATGIEGVIKAGSNDYQVAIKKLLIVGVALLAEAEATTAPTTVTKETTTHKETSHDVVPPTTNNKKEVKPPVPIDGDSDVTEALTIEEELETYTNKDLKDIAAKLEVNAGKKPNKTKLIEAILTIKDQDKIYSAIDSLVGDVE